MNLIFRYNSESACLVIHLLTNQMQIKVNSKKKSKFDLASFSLIRTLRTFSRNIKINSYI